MELHLPLAFPRGGALLDPRRGGVFRIGNRRHKIGEASTSSSRANRKIAHAILNTGRKPLRHRDRHARDGDVCVYPDSKRSRSGRSVRSAGCRRPTTGTARSEGGRGASPSGPLA
jgi:uncharacterized cupin superfamily protein